MLSGRSNQQASFAKTLGLVWVCLAAACFRLLTEEMWLEDVQDSDLLESEDGCKIFLKTLYGSMSVPIFKDLHNYLKAIPRDVKKRSLFVISKRRLYDALNRAVEMSPSVSVIFEKFLILLLSDAHISKLRSRKYSTIEIKIR